MPEVLVVFESWKLSLLDIVFLIVLFAVIVIIILEFLKKKNLNHRHEKILKFIDKKGKITTSEASKLLKVSEDTALRELTKLIEMRVIRSEGSGRSVHYVRK